MKNQVELFQEKLNSQFEKLIKIDEIQNKNSYKIEERKLMTIAYKFLVLIYGQDEMNNFGLEIVKTLQSCIKNFKADGKTQFSNYFNNSFSQNKKRAEYKNKIENFRSGISINAKIEQTFRKFEKLGKNLNDEKVLDLIAKMSNSTLTTVKQALIIYKNPVESDVLINENGEEYFQTEFLKVHFENPQNEKKDLKEFLKIILECFELIFNDYQERTKLYLSKLITANYIEDFVEIFLKSIDENLNSNENFKKVNLYFINFKFIDIKILTDFLRDKKLPSNFLIAQEFGKDKTDASRTLKNFNTKLSQLLKSKI